MPRDPDHSVYREWLYLEADGGLTTPERARLHRHLLSCARCRREKEQLPALFELLAGSRVEAREDLVERVMSSLPPAGWEARHPRSWIVAALLLAAVSGLSALMVGGGAGQLPGASALVSIAELFRSTIAAGAGLLAASWQGLGMAVGELIGRSPVETIVFALFVLGVDVLFLRFLVRSWRTERVGRGAQRDE